MVSRSHHWLHQFQLVTEHSLEGAINYGNHATGVGTKHAILRPRPRPGSSGLETKTETLDFRYRDQDRDLGLQVSRPRPRPLSLGLETETWTKWTWVSRPWSRDHIHITGCINSNWWQSAFKGATNYGNCTTGVGTKHALLRPRPRPGSSGLETKTENLDFRSQDQDRDLGH